MYFTADGLEQASAEVVSAHRSARFGGFQRVADLCCGIGGDAISLARQTAVVGVDVDPLKVRLAALNLDAYQLSHRVELVVGMVEAFEQRVDAAFIDPSRRPQGRRTRDPNQTAPPMSAVYALANRIGNVCVKAAPTLDYERVPMPCEVEVISVHGEVREAALWFGSLVTCRRRATLLPSGATITDGNEAAPCGPPGAYLLDPDGAVVRAHLIDEAAVALGAWKLDPNIAYLASDKPVVTPLARCYRVLEAFPFGMRELRAALRRLCAGRVVVKKRGLALAPEELQRQLRPTGDREVVVAIARVGMGHLALVCEPQLG
jgi:SAM-dependent methyltransferase